jgi:chromosome partitioning protein
VDPRTGDVHPRAASGAVVAAGGLWPWGLRVIASELSLASREQDRELGWESRLRTALEGEREQPRFDVILIDCPPSVGLLTVNALVAADRALLVTEPRAASVDGLAQMVRTIATVRRNYNPGLSLAGIVVNRWRPGRTDAGEWVTTLREDYKELLLEPFIPDREIVARATTGAYPLPAREGLEVLEALRLLTRHVTEGF